MRRYAGEPIAKGGRIAVVANDALGNFVIATPLLQMLRSAHEPRALDFFGGKRTAELQNASDLIDHAFELHGPSPAAALAKIQELEPYDHVVNVESGPLAQVAASVLAGEQGSVVGPCAGIGGRGVLDFSQDLQGQLAADTDWMRSDLLATYPFLQTPWIGEIFCRLAYLEGPVPAYDVPSAEPGREIPQILIATAASGSNKLWFGWAEVLELLRSRGISVGLLGAPPAAQKAFWKGDETEENLVQEGLVEDLRGVFTLPAVVGALSRAKAVLTLDNGIMHLAAATPTPTVALFRSGIRRLWAPSTPTLTSLEAEPGGAVSEIPVRTVFEALDAVL